MAARKPNVILLFGDQWRAQATGYAGDPNVRTPHIDRLAAESINFTHAVSGCPVCSPARASLLTGQYPLTHGVFVNDVCLSDDAVSMAQAFAGAGYDTAYIGKWHIDGHGRSNYIPSERRQGFDAYWQVLECTHDYNQSHYYDGSSDVPLTWEGYDAFAQTARAKDYIRGRDDAERPFLMVLSWGPPHAPYHTAPPEYVEQYGAGEDLELRPNVLESHSERAREWLAGYYAHCSALDTCVGDVLDTVKHEGMAEHTVVLFFSDHGDMLGSQGSAKKQQPWEESIRVPFLLRYPDSLGDAGRQADAPIDIPDIMPTLLGLCGIAVPETVEGLDFSGFVRGEADPSDGAALLSCPHPFGQWYPELGGKEFRGLRTRRHTYVRSLAGPWLLFDNDSDPYQMDNLVGRPQQAEMASELDAHLQRRLDQAGDEFLAGADYIERWGYDVDERGTVPYTG